MFTQSRNGDCGQGTGNVGCYYQCPGPRGLQTHLDKAKARLKIGRRHLELRTLPSGMGGGAERQSKWWHPPLNRGSPLPTVNYDPCIILHLLRAVLGNPVQ